HRLHRAQIRAAFEQVRCECMAQRVRGERLGQSRTAGESLEQLIEALARQMSTCAVRSKQKLVSALAGKARAHGEIALNRGACPRAQGHEACLAALSLYKEVVAARRHARERQPHQLAHAQARAIESFE